MHHVGRTPVEFPVQPPDVLRRVLQIGIDKAGGGAFRRGETAVPTRRQAAIAGMVQGGNFAMPRGERIDLGTGIV